MNLVRIACSNADASRPPRNATHRSALAHPHSSRCTLQPLPAQVLPKPHSRKQHRRPKQRRVRCDCGQLAVTVLQVRVGSDPQYTIRLPLCPACLNLEQELHASLSNW